jgi:putative transposase
LKAKEAFRFRLYPSFSQEERMLRALEASRRLWNEALAHRRARWEKERKSTSYTLQASILTCERKQDAFLGDLHSQVCQDVLRRLDKAFVAFFAHRSCYPKFKKSGQTRSFTYPQAYHGSAKPDAARKRLFLSGIGNIRAVFHRPIPKASRLKVCTVTKEPDGMWFASLIFEEVIPLQNLEPPAKLTEDQKSPVGIDLGLLSLITTSDGETVKHPTFLRKAEKRLKHLQRKLCRTKKASKNRFKARTRVASQHGRVRRQRLDFNHKLSTRLASEHALIVFEDLRIKNLSKNRVLAKSIQDAAWQQLITLTEYKALKVGSRVILVPAAYSTRECNICGKLNNKMGLNVRQFVCIGCGRTLDRDRNAASVVLKRGLIALSGLNAAIVGQAMPELMPVETKPLPVQTTGRASIVDDAGTICPQGAGNPPPLFELREDATRFARGG